MIPVGINQVGGVMIFAGGIALQKRDGKVVVAMGIIGVRVIKTCGVVKPLPETCTQ
jgi:hypothetical protein